MEKNDIKQKIDEVLLKCSNPILYLNILKDFFTNGIDKPSKSLESLNILPKINDKVLKKKFEDNKNKICDYIKNKITKKLSIYPVLSSIFGSFVGDVVGAFCEFYKCSKNNDKKIFKDKPIFNQTPGQVTDDSKMAMCYAYDIRDNPKKKIQIIYISIMMFGLNLILKIQELQAEKLLQILIITNSNQKAKNLIKIKIKLFGIKKITFQMDF